MKQRIKEFEGWPRDIARRTIFGNYKVWAIQSKEDGHCIFNVTIHPDAWCVWASGESEMDLYGKGSTQTQTRVYPNIEEFLEDWGLK